MAALGRVLMNENYNHRKSAVEFFTAAIAQGVLCYFYRITDTERFAEEFRDKIFDAEIVAALGCGLGDTNSEVRSSVVNLFTAAVAQGALLVLRDIHTKIFAEGIRNKIFENEIVAAIRCVLVGDTHPDVRNSAVNFFTAAMAQGVLRWFYGILISKYSQRGLGTTYLTRRSSPHLDVP